MSKPDSKLTEGKLKKIFNKFVGKEVHLNHRSEVEHGDAWSTYALNWYELRDESKTLVSDMKEVAKKHGLDLELHLPEQRLDDGTKENRVTAFVEPARGGKWKIGGRFDLG